MVRRLIKQLHEIGGVGVIGAFAACRVPLAFAPAEPMAPAREGASLATQALTNIVLAIRRPRFIRTRR